MQLKKKSILALALILVVLALAGCASTKTASSPVAVTAPKGDVVYEATYDIVGYRLLYRAYDNAVTFGFLNVLTAEEQQNAVVDMAKLLPGVTSYGISGSGQFTFNLKKTISKADFDKFVAEINKKAYDTIY